MKFSAVISTLASAAAVSAVSQQDAEKRFEAAGIGRHSSGGCTDKGTPSCTSYEGLREATVAGAITLKKACACSLTITGGTEVGHASGTYSHSNGYKLDFAKASGINGYITSTFTKIGDRGDGYPQWKAASGNIYCDEGNHWDVIFYSDGSSKLRRDAIPWEA